MAITRARAAIGRIFYQRCFYLFLVLLALIVGVPFIEPTPVGRFAANLMGIVVVIAAVAAIGRTVFSFVFALCLAVPTVVYHWLGVTTADAQWTLLSWCSAAALYAATLAYLLRYVFQRDVMTADRLFGAAAAYLMIGVLWGYLYAIVGYFYPGSYGSSSGVALTGYDYLYFSFTVLTSTGFGDITPLLRQARSLCVFEQLVGTLFLAILIARLAGVYSPRDIADER
jgi:Ion channel